ncbi:MAG: palindromic element RPE1 domain-containing protein [Candidatus Tisiphia sp.]
MLERYGINENNWHLYRFLIQKAADNKEYIIPTGEIPHDVLKEHFIKYVDNRRPLTEFASVEGFEGDSERKTTAYSNVREDSSTTTVES